MLLNYARTLFVNFKAFVLLFQNYEIKSLIFSNFLKIIKNVKVFKVISTILFAALKQLQLWVIVLENMYGTENSDNRSIKCTSTASKFGLKNWTLLGGFGNISQLLARGWRVLICKLT